MSPYLLRLLGWLRQENGSHRKGSASRAADDVVDALLRRGCCVQQARQPLARQVT